MLVSTNTSLLHVPVAVQGPSNRLKLTRAALDVCGRAVAGQSACSTLCVDEVTSLRHCVMAVIPPTEIDRPILPILMTRIASTLTSCLGLNPNILFLLLFVLPSLPLELASGTLVSALRGFGRSSGFLVGITATVPATPVVISPTGGRCDAYSSARLIRFFAHISAIPSMAAWKSGPSAARRMSAKSKAEMGGRARACPLRGLIGGGLAE